MQGVSRTSASALADHLDRVVTPASDAEVTQLADDLFAVVHLLSAEVTLRRTLSDPGLEPEQKAPLVDALFGTQVGPPAVELLRGAATARWSRAADLVDAVESLAVQALFTVGERAGSLDDTEDELFRFGRVVDREPALRSALADPALPGERKSVLLAALLENRASEATRRLVREAVLYPRGRTLDRALEEYGRAAAARRDRLVARVRSAVPLTSEQTDRLASALHAAYGRAVHLNVEVDPSVVGGISVRVGDEVFDGTIAHRLAEARRRLGG